MAQKRLLRHRVAIGPAIDLDPPEAVHRNRRIDQSGKPQLPRRRRPLGPPRASGLECLAIGPPPHALPAPPRRGIVPVDLAFQDVPRLGQGHRHHPRIRAGPRRMPRMRALEFGPVVNHPRQAAMSQIESAIANLRAVVGAKNDAELARLLSIDQSTISSWRSRGRVPLRFTKMLEAPSFQTNPSPPEGVWPELQDRATAVALARYVLLRRGIVNGGDMNKALAEFLDIKPFWLVMNRAVHDIRAKMEALRLELSTAAALVLQEDLRDAEATADRVASQLAEDIADNPWLQRWK